MASSKRRSVASESASRKKHRRSEESDNESADEANAGPSSNMRTVKARVEILAREILHFSLEKSKAVAVEYLRFMQLKAKYDKPNARSDLAPSGIVDQMWHTHLLDTRSYQALESLLLEEGGRIHHNPILKEQPRYARRLTHTLEVYEETFVTTPPADIWDVKNARDDESESSEKEDSDSSSDAPTAGISMPPIIRGRGRSLQPQCTSPLSSSAFGHVSPRRSPSPSKLVTGVSCRGPSRQSTSASTSLASSSRGPGQRSPPPASRQDSSDKPRVNIDEVPDYRFQFSIRVAYGGETYHFKARGTTSVRRVNTSLSERTGIDVDNQRLYLNGERLPHERSLAECGIKPGDCLDCIPTMSGC